MRRIVERLAFLFVVDGPCFVEKTVHFRVPIAAVVQPTLACDELMDVAVGIDAARPSDGVYVEITRLGFFLKGGEFGRSQRDIETRLSPHGLHDLGDLLRRRVVAERELELDALDTRFLQQRFRLGDVTLARCEPLVGIDAGLGKWLAGRREDALAHDLVDHIPIDRELQRLAHALVLAQWRFCSLAVAGVDRKPLIADAADRSEDEFGSLLTSGTSLGASRSRMSRLPALRFASRTVVSGIGVKTSLSKL